MFTDLLADLSADRFRLLLGLSAAFWLFTMVVPDPLPLVDEAALSAWLMVLLRERGRRKSLTPVVYPAVSAPSS